MLLKEMKLKNYKRLYVTSIKEVEYKPEKPIQIILGLNGSGKSSLLKEVIPNVDNVKDEYDVDGYKEIHIEHRGNDYILKYDRNTNKHSFLKNGKELNDGGLLKIQKQLIEDEFNLTKEINEILLSTNSFTTMSVGERKKWFTNILSDIDYSYAMSVYNKSKDRIKELQSFIKLLKSKMLDLSEYLNKPDDYLDSIKSNIRLLENYIAKLLEYKKPYTETNYEEYLKKLGLLIETLETQLAKISTYMETLSIKPTMLETMITKLNTELEILEKNKKEITVKLDKLSKLKLTEDDDAIKIKNEIDNIETELKELDKQLPSYIDVKDLPLIHDEFNESYLAILDILNELTDSRFTNVKINKEDFKEKKQKLNKLTEHKNKLITKIELLKDKIKHLEELKNNKEITCPKCGYKWKEGYSEVEHKELLKQLDNFTSDLNRIENEITELTKYLELVNEKIELLKTLKIYNNSILNPVFKFLTEKGTISDNPNMAMTRLMEIKTIIDKGDYVRKLIDRLDDLYYKKNILEKINDTKLKELLNKNNELSKELSDIVSRLNVITATLSKLKNYKNIVDSAKNNLSRLEDLLSLNNQYKAEAMTKHINNFINYVVVSSKELLSVMESDINKYIKAKDDYDKLSKEVDDYEKRLEIVKKITEWLSPNKGLIGKTAVETINAVLENMNQIINKIWSYEIKILPCDIENNDLTFRFPVLINGNKEIPDVSKGSSSIKEVIDLAFKITVMEFLNMLDYPLILDEFGRTMDPTHRIRAYDFIEDIAKNYFSQIYLVSHFESMYNRFTNADVVVLSEENIVVDREYNKVIKLK